MKIALVTLDYPPARGGVARYLANLVDASQGQIEFFSDQSQFIGNGFWPWRSAIGFVRGLKRRGYDTVLVSHLLPIGTAAWISRLGGGPEYAVIVHGLDFRLACRSWFKRRLTRCILRRAKIVITNSRFVAHELEVFDARLTPLALTPGVEPIIFSSRDESRHKMGVSETDFIILTIARLVPRKGIDTLLKVLPTLPSNVKYVVIGDGDDRERLKKLAEPVKDRVTFIADASDEQRNTWLAAADVFAFLARDEGYDVEGFGIVCLEASLAGLPVVAGRSGGVTEAVQDEVTGLLVEPTDTAAIEQAIERLIHRPDLRQKLGQAGRARAQRDFIWEKRWQRMRAALNPQPVKAAISVVIPVYNHAPELVECLQTLERQTLKPTEVIIIDDASTDQPEERIKSLSLSFPVNIERLAENRGAPVARNQGFKRATGEFVLFLDADIQLRPDALDRMARALELNPDAAFAYSSFRFGWKLFKALPFDVARLKQVNYIHTSSLIRRENFPGFDESLKKLQDWDLWLTIVERGGYGIRIPDVLMKIATGGTMSRWLPSFVHRLPWTKLGWMPREIQRYREAESIVKRKHNL